MFCTINYKGHSLSIDGNHTKGEARTHMYPGSAPEFEITSIEYKDVEIKGLLEDLGIDVDDIEREVIEQCELS